MDMNKSILEDSHYMDDLIDQMEKGELKTDVLFDEQLEKTSFNQRLINTSKRVLKFYRQNSDTSLDMNMSICSDTSNESTLSYENLSPFSEERDNFNWEISNNDFENKIDDSNLDEFYDEYKTFILDPVPKNKETNIKLKPRHILDKAISNVTGSNHIVKTNKTKRGKYYSFNHISNSL
jgi:hypothetical protein